MEKRLQVILIGKAFVLFFAVLTISVGCQGNRRWGGSQFGQGSVERQKNRAVTFDPYPLNDIGPPIVGGRPREYANPLAEPARNELTARPPYSPFSR